jgi:hypothetical protein
MRTGARFGATGAMVLGLVCSGADGVVSQEQWEISRVPRAVVGSIDGGEGHVNPREKPER